MFKMFQINVDNEEFCLNVINGLSNAQSNVGNAIFEMEAEFCI